CIPARAVLFALIVGTFAPAVPAAAAGSAVHFDRDIRPLLSDTCYACHGPGQQEAGLRLDSAEAATAELESGARAVVPGDAAASAMLARITSTDPDVVMPPPHTNKTLTAEQKALLANWIATGAPYEPHWSFRPIVRPDVPAATDPASTSPIDRFLEDRLAREGLPVNAEADRPTLARRISFALTGLPPTSAEVEAFVNDTAPDASERLVERLLASPHHGEEMARHWLDAARYADTHGLHLDNERQMWAYRDWVVQAFNEAMPFDRFTIHQLAGDLLPNATAAQKTATGFSRCNVTTNEGGSINDELLFRYAVDRTATTINVFMGMTGQCAVCHSHKFDPISQKEFYSLYAFFNSAADPGFDENALVTGPAVKMPSAEQERELAALGSQVTELAAALDSHVTAVAYADPATLDPRPEPAAVEHVWLDDDFPAGADVKSTPGSTTWLEGDAIAGVFSGRRSVERTAQGTAQDFFERAAAPLAIPRDAEIFAHVWIDPANPPKSVMLQFHAGPAGWDHRAVWGDQAAIDWGKAGTTSRHHVGPLPEPGRWVRLAVPAAAIGLGPDDVVTGFSLTQSDGHVRWDKAGVTGVDDAMTDPRQSLAAWWRARAGRDQLDDVPQELRDLVRKGPDAVTAPDDVARVRRHWMLGVWSGLPPSVTRIRGELEAARAARTNLENAIPQTFIFTDLPTMRDSFVMLRGAYDKRGEKVSRGTPAFLPPLAVAEGATPNRLDLAKWLLSPDHPLTARVAANRLWQQFFGTGLVKTSADFGLQGEPPSHPELLDWLAAEYRDRGWDTRQMVRLLVTSRAFRRASEATPGQFSADPENRLLARGPRFRLDAEQIRDNALAVSGLLVRKMGGRGAMPYQPPNIWEPVGFVNSNTRYYKQDSGEGLYRRSLYTFFKRTAPHPFLATFDAPNREQFCGRRERSNTPLQALQLMNDVQHVEAARALAGRTLAEGGSDDDARIGWLFRTVLARDPRGDEAGIVAETLAGHRARYAADEAAAAKVISHGESPPPAGVPATELAPWTLVTTMLLNLDETLTRN
ncbi:MAG: PSD1 and planctomycete cytochrome C domain-containing protein, partial [Pirellulales bacterium]